ERKLVREEARKVDSPLGDPSHGQRKVTSEVGVDARVDRDVLEKEISPSNVVEPFLGHAKVKNAAALLAEVHASVEGLVLVPDGLDHQIRHGASRDAGNRRQTILLARVDDRRRTHAQATRQPRLQRIDGDDLAGTQVPQSGAVNLTHGSLS